MSSILTFLILTFRYILATCRLSMHWKGVNGGMVNGAKLNLVGRCVMLVVMLMQSHVNYE